MMVNPDKRGNNQHKRKSQGNDNVGPSNEVAVAFGKGGQNNGGKWKGKKGEEGHYSKAPKVTYDDIKDEPCAHHSKLGKCTHTNRQCRLVDEFKKDPDAGYKSKNFKRKGRKDNKDSMSEPEESEPK